MKPISKNIVAACGTCGKRIRPGMLATLTMPSRLDEALGVAPTWHHAACRPGA